jgi:hypothetical protein
VRAGAIGIRRSGALRVAIAVLIPAAIGLVWVLANRGPLNVQTDVIGWPTFYNYNYKNYFHAYYAGVIFVPLAALALFIALSRYGNRIGLIPPPSRGPLRPAMRPPEPPALAPDPPLAAVTEPQRIGSLLGRLAVAGAVVGLEAAVLSNSVRPAITLGIVGYSLIVLLLGMFAGARIWPQWPLRARLAAVNAVAALGGFFGLFLVSQHTRVLILADGSSVHYHWLPVWLALPVLAGLVATVVVALHRAVGPERSFEIERRVLLLISAPLLLYLTISSVPGEQGFIDMFHGGELVVGSNLVQHGDLPWRDIVLTHGIFQDVIYGLGRTVFGNSVWGAGAGIDMIMRPLYLLSVFFLFVYLVGRNWLFLLFAGLLIVGPYISPEQFRLVLWPLILLLLATDLRRPTVWKSLALGSLAVVQTILTPETVPALFAIGVVLVAYEWYWREPGSTLAAAFRRSIWVAGAGAVVLVAFAIFLIAEGALDDFVYVSVNLLHGLTQASATPPGPGVGPSKLISNPLFVFLTLAPPVAMVICFAYGATRLWRRQPLLIEDWVMGTVAIFLLFYYPKFLSRMDTGHVYQAFVLAFPLIVYIVFRVVSAIEGGFRGRWPRSPVLKLTAHPLSLAIVALTLCLSWGHYQQRIGQTPAYYSPAVNTRPHHPRVGYTHTFNGKALSDIKQVVDTYLKPGDPIFDFTNTPLLFHYLIDRKPSTRWFHVTLTFAPKLQDDLIRRLAKSPPKLIAFDNDGIPFAGLAAWDGIPDMVRTYKVAQWILDRYRPLLWTHGITFYARRDMPPPSQAGLHLRDKPITAGVPYTVQPCSWGYAPNFLTGAPEPPAGAPETGARARKASSRITIEGWAGDPNAKVPAREVIAVADGKIVGRTVPSIDRPDLVAFGLPKGFEHAGYRMQVMAAPGAGVQVYGVSRSGGLTELVQKGEKPSKGSVEIDGRKRAIEPQAVYGQVNSKAREQALRFSLPAGSQWTDYRWLEVDAGASGFKPGTFTVYDKENRPSAGREISFRTLDSSPRRYVVPVGSCSQWHAYSTRGLFLNSNARQHVTAVRLIR